MPEDVSAAGGAGSPAALPSVTGNSRDEPVTSARGSSAPGRAEERALPEGDRSEDPAAGSRRRRGTHRRATGGAAPDAERALGDPDWGDAARRLGADAPEPGEGGSAGGHEQWLREQRPPHWG